MRIDDDGRYAFTTIRPVPCTGRTPQIHFAARAPRQRALITQMFVAGIAQNQRDYLYTSMTQAQRARVTARLESSSRGQRALRRGTGRLTGRAGHSQDHSYARSNSRRLSAVSGFCRNPWMTSSAPARSLS